MAKKESISHREIIRSIRKGECEPVYILMGEEAYYIDLIVENFEKHLIPEEDRDFNYNMFYGNEADVDYIVGVAQQFPVMADRKLVILKEAQSMTQAKNQLEKFASYCARPNPNTVFVIAFKGDNLNANSKLLKAVKEGGGVVFRSPVPRDYQLPPLIKDYCTARRIGIEEKAVNLLAEYIGAPLSKLFGELNKLIVIKGSGDTRITCEDIEKNIGISKDFNNFELINALSEKNYPKAMQIVKHFASTPKSNPTVMTTSVMFTFYSNLVIAHYMADKSEAAFREQFGFKAPAQFAGMRNALRNYTAAQAVNAIHYLREFDVKSKGVGSMANEYDLLSELMFKLFV